ncbi:MAG: hypothetical protein IJ087_19880 [Eggerthellaceae bacterium]|nr:hypothetical protein [Eggerthellaceae bacterium]
MDGKENEIANGAGATAQEQAQEGKPGAQAAGEAGAPQVTPPATSPNATAANPRPAGAPKPAVDYAAELAKRDTDIAERDGKIAELEGKLADAEKLGQQAETLKSENEQLKNQAASERIDFALQLAGCRSVKAARAVLDDYDGDIEKLKAAEPWMFEAQTAQAGATGLPNAGTASDDGKDERRWRKLVGLSAKKPE